MAQPRLSTPSADEIAFSNRQRGIGVEPAPTPAPEVVDDTPPYATALEAAAALDAAVATALDLLEEQAKILIGKTGATHPAAWRLVPDALVMQQVAGSALLAEAVKLANASKTNRTTKAKLLESIAVRYPDFSVSGFLRNDSRIDERASDLNQWSARKTP